MDIKLYQYSIEALKEYQALLMENSELAGLTSEIYENESLENFVSFAIQEALRAERITNTDLKDRT